MLPLKGSNRLNYVYHCGLICLKTMSSCSQRQRGPKLIPLKLTEGRRHRKASWKSLNLVIGIVSDLAWSYSRFQIIGKYSGRCPYIFILKLQRFLFCLGLSKNGVSKWDLCVLCLLCLLNI